MKLSHYMKIKERTRKTSSKIFSDLEPGDILRLDIGSRDKNYGSENPKKVKAYRFNDSGSLLEVLERNDIHGFSRCT